MRNPFRSLTTALSIALLLAVASSAVGQSIPAVQVLRHPAEDEDWTLAIRRQEDAAPRDSNSKANSSPRLALLAADDDLGDLDDLDEKTRQIDRELDAEFFHEKPQSERLPDFTASPSRSTVQYKLGRGSDVAYRVEINTGEGFPRRRWLGLPYFLTIYPTEDHSPAITVCVGTLHCATQSSEEQAWVPEPEQNIYFPKYVAVHPTYASADRSSPTDRKTQFPRRIRLVLSPEDIMFPRVPVISNSPKNENRGRRSYDIMEQYGTKEISGTFQQLSQIEYEDSDRPSVVRQYLFQSPEENIVFGIRQVCTFDREAGLIESANITYQAMWDGTLQLKVTAKRLTGDRLSKVRAIAAEQFSAAELPQELRRSPAVGVSWLDMPKLNAATELRSGQRVICRAKFTELRLGGGTRYYRARVIEPLTTSEVLVELDGSMETLELDYDDVFPQ